MVILKDAHISACKSYRYTLMREWTEHKPKMGFIGLNPSTADGYVDDATITRLTNFARIWGYGGFFIVNLFAYRSTDPRMLTKADNPIGKHNNQHILDIDKKIVFWVAMWGKHGTLLNRDVEVLNLLKHRELFCFGTNKDGTPKHPLYLPYSSKPKKFFSDRRLA